jgi:uncharacterized integral membrane protein
MTEGKVEMTPKRIVFLVLGVLLATFVIQNADVAQVRFLFWSADMSRALVILGAFILGAVVGWVSGRMYSRASATAVGKGS